MNVTQKGLSGVTYIEVVFWSFILAILIEFANAYGRTFQNGMLVGRWWTYSGIWSSFFIPQLGFGLMVPIGYVIFSLFGLAIAHLTEIPRKMSIGILVGFAAIFLFAGVMTLLAGSYALGLITMIVGVSWLISILLKRQPLVMLNLFLSGALIVLVLIFLAGIA